MHLKPCVPKQTLLKAYSRWFLRILKGKHNFEVNDSIKHHAQRTGKEWNAEHTYQLTCSSNQRNLLTVRASPRLNQATCAPWPQHLQHLCSPGRTPMAQDTLGTLSSKVIRQSSMEIEHWLALIPTRIRSKNTTAQLWTADIRWPLGPLASVKSKGGSSEALGDHSQISKLGGNGNCPSLLSFTDLIYQRTCAAYVYHHLLFWCHY